MTLYFLKLSRQYASLFLLTWLLIHASSQAVYPQDSLHIAIVQPGRIDAYQEAVSGFLEYLGEHLDQDFNTTVYEQPADLYRALEKPQQHAGAQGLDLILTVGSEFTAEVSQYITDIPIVFTMVLNPDTFLDSQENVVGASLNIPLEIQLNMIQEILPGARNIGIIYHPEKNADLVRESTAIAKALHLRIKAFPVNSPKEIPEALKQVSKEADVLWGVVDDLVYTSQTAKFIIKDTILKYHLPFIGFSVPYVKAGALYALTFESRDIGRQSAELAQQILHGTPVARLRNTVPEHINFAVNLRTAEIIGVNIPPKIWNNAAVVYE